MDQVPEQQLTISQIVTDKGIDRFQRYKEHVDSIGLSYHGDVMAIGPGGEEMALLEEAIQSGEVTGVTVSSLCHPGHLMLGLLSDINPLVPVVNTGMPWSTFFHAEPGCRFGTITFLGMVNTEDLPEVIGEFVSHLTDDGQVFITANYRTAPPEKPSVPGAMVEFFPAVPSNPNYEGLYCGMAVRRNRNISARDNHPKIT